MIKEFVEASDINQLGEEFSARSYLNFMLEFIRSKGGVVDQADLFAEIRERFGPYWGPNDLRLLKKRPKWMNTVDWAKVGGRKLKEPILSRTVRRQGKKLTILVLETPETDPEWLEWVKDRIPKKHFRKRCPQCKRRKIRLAAAICPRCKYVFPPKARRKHELPR